MQNLGYVMIAFGFLFAGLSGASFWVGKKIISNPNFAISSTIGHYELEPEPLRLLKYLYELQARYDLHKMLIARDGLMILDEGKKAPKINVVAQFFNTEKADPQACSAFEKLIFKIPVTYLRNIPEARYDSPYVLSVTPEGIMYLKGKLK